MNNIAVLNIQLLKIWYHKQRKYVVLYETISDF